MAENQPTPSGMANKNCDQDEHVWTSDVTAEENETFYGKHKKWILAGGIVVVLLILIGSLAGSSGGDSDSDEELSADLDPTNIDLPILREIVLEDDAVLSLRSFDENGGQIVVRGDVDIQAGSEKSGDIFRMIDIEATLTPEEGLRFLRSLQDTNGTNSFKLQGGSNISTKGLDSNIKSVAEILFGPRGPISFGYRDVTEIPFLTSFVDASAGKFFYGVLVPNNIKLFGKSLLGLGLSTAVDASTNLLDDEEVDPALVPSDAPTMSSQTEAPTGAVDLFLPPQDGPFGFKNLYPTGWKQAKQKAAAYPETFDNRPTAESSSQSGSGSAETFDNRPTAESSSQSGSGSAVSVSKGALKKASLYRKAGVQVAFSKRTFYFDATGLFPIPFKIPLSLLVSGVPGIGLNVRLNKAFMGLSLSDDASLTPTDLLPSRYGLISESIKGNAVIGGQMAFGVEIPTYNIGIQFFGQALVDMDVERTVDVMGARRFFPFELASKMAFDGQMNIFGGFGLPPPLDMGFNLAVASGTVLWELDSESKSFALAAIGTLPSELTVDALPNFGVFGKLFRWKDPVDSQFSLYAHLTNKADVPPAILRLEGQVALNVLGKEWDFVRFVAEVDFEDFEYVVAGRLNTPTRAGSIEMSGRIGVSGGSLGGSWNYFVTNPLTGSTFSLEATTRVEVSPNEDTFLSQTGELTYCPLGTEANCQSLSVLIDLSEDGVVIDTDSSFFSVDELTNGILNLANFETNNRWSGPVPETNEPFALSETESDNLLIAASLSNRVYRFKNSDSFESFEEFFEDPTGLDAAVVAVYPDKCFVAFQGTRPVESTEVDEAFFGFPGLAKEGLADILSNVDNRVKLPISNIENTATCEISQGYFESYERLREFVEPKVESDCIAMNKPIYLTGHSQGGALAQIAGVRFESSEPKMYLFAPAPTFFDECPSVPDSRMLSFVNSEEDTSLLSAFNTQTPVEYDVIPFADALVQYLSGAPRALLGPFLEYFGLPNISLEKAFVGSYNGPFVVLSPNDQVQASYVRTRLTILNARVSVDLLDAQEFFDPDVVFKVLSTHNMDEYERKIKAVVQGNENRFAANGFQTSTWCPAGSKFLCEDTCISSGICTSFQKDEPCVPFAGTCTEGTACVPGLNRCKEPCLLFCD